VTGTGDETKLSGIMRLVADAQESKSRAQHLADRAAQLLTGVALLAAVVTFVVWQLIGAPIDFSIVRVVTVLVIACPHALGARRAARGGHLHHQRRAGRAPRP
jgi:P-type Cu2+ transporter